MVKKPASKKRIAVAEHACEQCAAKRKKIEDVEAEVAVFKKEIDEKNREIEILNAKIDSLKDEMEGATRKIVELQGQKEKHHNALLSREPDGGIDLASKVTELLQRVKQLEKLHNIKTCPTEIYKFKGNESNVSSENLGHKKKIRSPLIRLLLSFVLFQVCAVLEGKNIFINKDVKSAILDLTTCKQVATQTMMSIFTDEFLQNATVEGKLNGKEGLPKEGLDAILSKLFQNDLLRIIFTSSHRNHQFFRLYIKSASIQKSHQVIQSAPLSKKRKRLIGIIMIIISANLPDMCKGENESNMLIYYKIPEFHRRLFFKRYSA